MLQNNTCLDSNFEWIFFVLASENESKIRQFAYLYQKRNFAKIIIVFMEIIIFLVRSHEKSTKIGCSNAVKNNVETKSLGNRVWEAIWLSKILENRPPKRCKTKLVLRRYGNLAHLVGN